MSVRELIGMKRDEMLAIAERHGARNVRLFGSAARGETRPDSDIDLLVEMEPGRTLLHIVAIKQDIEDLLGREVHVVTEAAVSVHMRESVLKGSVPL